LNDAWNTSSFLLEDWNEIVFNNDGLAAIMTKQNDTFLIAMISKEDFDNSAPADKEYIWFYSTSTAGKEPYLSITYTPPIVAPTVTTQAASDIATTSCTGNGNITNTGGANCTRRGFCYKVGTSGDPTTADSVAYDNGSFGAGAYTKSITGLTAGTGYRVRAYAVNAEGTGYGATVQITTTHIQAIGGTLVPSGILVKALDLHKALGGNITPSGVLSILLTAYRTLGGTFTPTGDVDIAAFFELLLGGELDLEGTLSGRNPDWLLIDETLRWMGEWDATYSYDINDVVLHQFGDEWHVFISKVGHNVGNIPTSSATYWRRLYQEQWQ
jgi:hypothetical protein